MDWTIVPLTDNTVKLKVPYERNANWFFKILCTADRHIDHKLSDINLQKKHLKEAQAGGWPVIDIGDLFCAMQGRYDPRSTRRALLNCLNEKEEYLDALVDYAESILAPFKNNLAMLGLGNHETSQLRRNETHILNRLVKRLGPQTVVGGYQGWIKVHFNTGADGGRQSLNIRYVHGSGGCAPVTKGVIKTNRRAVVYPDANIILSGHSHEQWIVPISRYRLNARGNEFRDEQLHVQIPSYKDDVTGEIMGWAVEKEMAPKPTGAIWLKFWYEEGVVKYDAERAL